MLPVAKRQLLTAARLGWALHWRHALNWAQKLYALRPGQSSSRAGADHWARSAPSDCDARSELDAYVWQMTRKQREDSRGTFLI